MKRVGHLFEQIVAWENLLLAYHKARRGKREQRSVVEFTYRQEGELLQLQRELREGSYQPEPLREFWITDPKKRLISAAPFRDRVVQRIHRIDAGWSIRKIRKIRKIREGRILSADSRRFPQIICEEYDGEEMSTESPENTEKESKAKMCPRKARKDTEKERSAKKE